MIGIIAAVSENGIIGINNNIPWIGKYPEDLKRFKKLTVNSNIIMGSKTWRSIGEKPLPNRNNIIISSKLNIETDQVSVANSVQTAIRMCKFNNNKPIWIIGGESIYQQSMNLIDWVKRLEVEQKMVFGYFLEMHLMK